jgi:hypothetical protein
MEPSQNRPYIMPQGRLSKFKNIEIISGFLSDSYWNEIRSHQEEKLYKHMEIEQYAIK